MQVQHVNELGQQVGAPVPDWSARERPGREPMTGRYCRVEPIDIARHASDLFEACLKDREHRMWTYLSYGPFLTLDQYRDWLAHTALGADPFFHAIIDLGTGKAVGVAAYLRIDPAMGSIEVGHLAFSPLLARTRLATEAMALMMERAFTLGYRRYEWKCNALNAKSRAAALRLGLSYEGVFRNAGVTRGRNRDTAWFAAVDGEWPALSAAFARWLAPENFDARGMQRERLSQLRGASAPGSRTASDPGAATSAGAPR